MRSNLIVGLCLLLLCGCASTTPGRDVEGQTQAVGMSGIVLEALDASNYTYLNLQLEDGTIWAAVPRTSVKVGTSVTIENPARMDGFESKTLQRRFDKIVFGTLKDSASRRIAAPPEIAAPQGRTDVAKADAENGRTVAELYAQKQDLADRAVTIRGQVMKYSGGILGRNWIHLQDGSGDPVKGTHDITVTTADETAVGQVIVIEGTVRLDKDFGAGYRYEVIVEDATILR